MSGGLRRMALGLTGALFFMVAGHASAHTYCVNKLGGKCLHVDTLTEAVQLSDADDDHDRIEIGPGVYHEAPIRAAKPVTIVGEGDDKTTLAFATVPESGQALGLWGERSALLDVRLIYDGSEPTGHRSVLAIDGSVERIALQTTGEGRTGGIVLWGTQPTVRDSVVDLSFRKNDLAAILVANGFGVVEDVAVRAPKGFSGRGRVSRSRFEVGSQGLDTGWQYPRQLAVDNTVVFTDVMGSEIREVAVHALGEHSKGIRDASISLQNVTLVGTNGTGSSGLQAEVENTNPGHVSASIHARDVIVAGYDQPIHRLVHAAGGSSTGSASVHIEHSVYDPASVSENGPGAITTGPGNLLADPQFVSARMLDARLRPSSPLIDRGTPAPAAFGLDVLGRSRVVDGDADGSARRDIGAFESQGSAVITALSAIPAAPAVGETVTFTATVVAGAEGEVTGHLWDLDGDGTFETDTGLTPSATRAYEAPGAATARLRVVGSDGAITERAVTVGVAALAVTGTPTADPAPAPVGRPVASPPLTVRGVRFSRRAFTVRLSAPATTVITITRKVKRRYRRVIRLTRHLPAGASRIGKRLRPGRYRARIVATDASGRRATAPLLTFQVTRSRLARSGR